MIDLREDVRVGRSKWWQGLLTLQLPRARVSKPDTAGNLRCGRGPGTGWAGAGVTCRTEAVESGDPRRAVSRDGGVRRPAPICLILK